jgi:long-subunit fatty acid transport protein
VTDKLCVRFGYEFRPTSVQADRFDMLLHLPDVTWIGAGIGVTGKKGLKLDLSFALMFNKGYKVPNNFSKNLNSTTFTDIVYNPLAGLNYEQDLAVYIMSVGIEKPF